MKVLIPARCLRADKRIWNFVISRAHFPDNFFESYIYFRRSIDEDLHYQTDH